MKEIHKLNSGKKKKAPLLKNKINMISHDTTQLSVMNQIEKGMIEIVSIRNIISDNAHDSIITRSN